jgi:putative transposase
VFSVVTEEGSTQSGSLIDGIVREGARRMPAARPAALAMVFKLVESAQARWRAITGAHLVPLVRAGAWFKNGVLVEREEAAA